MFQLGGNCRLQIQGGNCGKAIDQFTLGELHHFLLKLEHGLDVSGHTHAVGPHHLGHHFGDSLPVEAAVIEDECICFVRVLGAQNDSGSGGGSLLINDNAFLDDFGLFGEIGDRVVLG